MAKVKSMSVELTVLELALVVRALRLVENYGLVGDEEPARRLVVDLEMEDDA